MLFVPSSQASDAVALFPTEATDHLAGALYLKRELSTSSASMSDPEPDADVPEIRLPIPKVRERAEAAPLKESNKPDSIGGGSAL